jgi:hypothetical protein
MISSMELEVPEAPPVWLPSRLVKLPYGIRFMGMNDIGGLVEVLLQNEWRESKESYHQHASSAFYFPLLCYYRPKVLQKILVFSTFSTSCASTFLL